MKNNTLTLLGIGVVAVGLLGYTAYSFLGNNEDVAFKGQYGRGGNGPMAEQQRVAPVEEVAYTIDESDFVDSATLLADSAAKPPVSAEEQAGLLLMREEEKLARDVYLALADTWGVRVFSNIAASEATHMEAMGDLLERYDIADPITTDTRGVFTNPNLQQLYTDLVAKGSVSAAEAFKVGALIEDLDINDLENLLATTDKADIRLVYENLQKGSRNHLRAFTRQIERGGDVYEPTYITEAEYKAIIESGQERGRM